jgi:hypothetical protein
MNCGYFSIEAIGSPYNYFYDGEWYYERAKGLSGLSGIDGFLRKIGKKLKKVAKKGLKVVKKVAKKTAKIVKKGAKLYVKALKTVGKATVKFIHKALPVVNTALAFFPGVGWAVSAALTVAEMGMNYAKKKYDQKKARELAKKLNQKKTLPVTPAKPVTPANAGSRKVKVNPVLKVNKPAASSAPMQAARVQPVDEVYSQPEKRRAQYLTVADLMKIQTAVQRQTVSPEYVAALANKEVYGSLSQILRS